MRLFFNLLFVLLAGSGIVLSFASGFYLLGVLFVVVSTLKVLGVVRVEWCNPWRGR